MQRDAHYYAILAFARGCGFKKDAAHTLAHASQYVDDAKVNHIAVRGLSDPIPGAEPMEDGSQLFINVATCHQYLWLKTLNYGAMMNNTCAFHFVPGCKDEIGNSFVRKLKCRESSPVIENIIEEAIQDDDLVKFGMVLHPYADTFSHQEFVGFLSKVNDIEKVDAKGLPLDRKFLDLAPVKFLRRRWREKYHITPYPYGHVHAMTYPDMAKLEWSYEYDNTAHFTASKGNYKKESVNNISRFTHAFQRIKQYLERYLETHAAYRDETITPLEFDELFRPFKSDTLIEAIKIWRWEHNWKEKRWRTFLVDKNLNLFDETDKEYVEYDEDKWLRELFTDFDKRYHERTVEGAWVKPEYSTKERFMDTEWFRYFSAVQWYKRRFYHYCAGEGLEIPNDYGNNDSE